MGDRATVVAWRGGDGNHIKSGRHKRTRERRRRGGGNDGRQWSSAADVDVGDDGDGGGSGIPRRKRRRSRRWFFFVSDGSYDDVVLNRVQTTLANRSDFIRVNNGLLGSVSQSTQCRLVRFTSVMFRVHVRVPVQQV
ncbi:hypothetical protein HanXRQr2_Chr07g0287791 [Helianthus annuus]|uniref:Uncharacterized protein n=1 Tax=Helianthus annuus TaxID=4232 RepID=A0A9K3NFA8_HELAN|nr:hypothetical protein HanXRQr2_Chr07g0287791 [Helianthus annuus]